MAFYPLKAINGNLEFVFLEVLFILKAISVYLFHFWEIGVNKHASPPPHPPKKKCGGLNYHAPTNPGRPRQ